MRQAYPVYFYYIKGVGVVHPCVGERTGKDPHHLDLQYLFVDNAVPAGVNHLFSEPSIWTGTNWLPPCNVMRCVNCTRSRETQHFAAGTGRF